MSPVESELASPASNENIIDVHVPEVKSTSSGDTVGTPRQHPELGGETVTATVCGVRSPSRRVMLQFALTGPMEQLVAMPCNPVEHVELAPEHVESRQRCGPCPLRGVEAHPTERTTFRALP